MTPAVPGPAGPPASRRHRGYLQLLAVCLLVLALFTLPYPWSRLSSPGYLLLGLVVIRVLANPECEVGVGRWPRRLFRLLGLATLTVSLVWALTPLELRRTGVPVILLWGMFSLWSAIRLVRLLALERVVNGPVLRGALAGYLMIGLAAGMLCAALETVAPGSFSNVGLSPEVSAGAVGSGAVPSAALPSAALPSAALPLDAGAPVWHFSFIRLQYYAFVALTTTGFGEVIPLTPQAQMLSVAIAISGTVYVAAVMGLLIARVSAQQH
jgi:voltage-gated potassium channel